MKFVSLIIPILICISCASNQEVIPVPKNYFVVGSEVFTLKAPSVIGETASHQKIYLGGFSGLLFVKENSGEYVFKSITDRGPNGWQKQLDRPFLLPEFSPEIVTLKTNRASKEIIISEELKLKKKDGQLATGLPNKRTEENPIDIFGMMFSIDTEGIDTESIAFDGENGYWIGEEYSPSLIHVENDGRMTRRFLPNGELPRIYNERPTNRGFEALIKNENKLFGFLQSPLPFDKEFSRIVEVDLDSNKTTAEYFYKLDPQSDRIGDAALLPNKRILVIEQNGKANEKSYKKVYQIELNGSDQLVSKHLVVDLDLTEFKKFEKVEGITIVDKRHIALINDNDFGINAETDFKTGLTPIGGSITQLLILELNQDLY